MVPICTGIGKARWGQGAEGNLGVEIQIPSSLPKGVRPRDLTVEIKDSTVLLVRHGDTTILQWRLYAPVNDEVSWRVEDGTMIVELEKKSDAVWSCLLDLPLRSDDDLLVSVAELNRMFAQQLPHLPPASDPVGSSPKEDESANGKAADFDDDLDRLLEEAAEEVQSAKTDEEDTYASFVKAELENYAREVEEIKKKMSEVEEVLMAQEENEATTAALEQKKILEEMLRIHNICRELRAGPSSLESFLECTRLDLRKARVNVGAMTPNEEEEYANKDEQQMSATELMTAGLKLYSEEDLKGCLHFLRLAAIHHQQEQSIILLYSLYSQLGSPRGAFILLNRALDDVNPSVGANLQVGELYDQGARHFLPLFPASVYFYQRAAKLGSVKAMVSLAQLWLRGSTASSLLSEEQAEAQKSISKYHSWLQRAVDRGCGSAMFVKGCMYLKGEHGVSRSYAQAKEYLDAANASQPEILKRAPQIPLLLESLRTEVSKEAAGDEEPQSPATAVTNKADDDVAVARLNGLSRTGASFASKTTGNPASNPRRAKKAFGVSAHRKAFWEKATVTGLVGYGAYVIAFPLRIMALPMVYSILAVVADAIPWLANHGDASSIL